MFSSAWLLAKVPILNDLNKLRSKYILDFDWCGLEIAY